MSSYGGLRVGTDSAIYFHKTYNVGEEGKVWVGTTIVLYVTQHFASHDIRDVPVPVICFHKTYNLCEEGKVRVGTSIVLYVTQHFASNHMEGLGLAPTRYIFS